MMEPRPRLDQDDEETDSATVRDLWAHQDLGSLATSYTAPAVPSHGVVMLKVAGQ